MNQPENFWQKCRTCGKPIGFRTRYYTCSVSTCNKKSNPLVFCSVDCWDIHAPVMNHKNAGAEEDFSPSYHEQHQLKEPPQSNVSQEHVPRRRIIVTPSGAQKNSPLEKGETHFENDSEKDILIVASKLKAYVRNQSGFNTSAQVMDHLSNIVRQLCDKAIENARKEGRKTVMDRDFP